MTKLVEGQEHDVNSQI